MDLCGLLFEACFELQFGKHQSDRTPRMFLISFLASFFEPGSSLVHVSGPVSGDVFELGSELPFAAPFNRIELRRSSWTRCWSWPRARGSCRSHQFLVSFLVSFLNLAPSSNLGDINQIELRGCFWSRFSRRFGTWLMRRACFWSFLWCRF